MPSNGYITVRAYSSRARLPIQDAAIAITDQDGKAIALRLTDRSGQIDPIAVMTPDLSAGQQPDTGTRPYTIVNIYARANGYEQIEAENVQIFPNTVTDQNLEMIPLPEFPESWIKTEIFRTPPQNL